MQRSQPCGVCAASEAPELSRVVRAAVSDQSAQVRACEHEGAPSRISWPTLPLARRWQDAELHDAAIPTAWNATVLGPTRLKLAVASSSGISVQLSWLGSG